MPQRSSRGAVRLPVNAETHALLLQAAEQRSLPVEALVEQAVRAFIAPSSTRDQEAEELGALIARPPLERLNPVLRLAVRIAGTTIRWFWTLVGRGRYRIGSGLLCNGRLQLRGPGRISIGRDVNAWARSGSNRIDTFRSEATVSIGDRVRLNGAGIQAATRVEIGDDAILGSCTIVDTDHHAARSAQHSRGEINTRPIRIGRNVWIGGAVVLKGVNVGDNSVIGLGAVVTTDVPPNVVMAGNPARVVRRLDDP